MRSIRRSSTGRRAEGSPLSDERSLAWHSVHESLVFQDVYRLLGGHFRYSISGRERRHRRDGCPRLQMAGLDLGAEQIGELLVERLRCRPVQWHEPSVPDVTWLSLD